MTRIEYSTEGGLAYFPGLNRAVAIEVDSLGNAEATMLKNLIMEAQFFDLPAVLGALPSGAADAQCDVLVVDDGGSRHAVRILAADGFPALQALLQLVKKHVKALRAAQRSTPG